MRFRQCQTARRGWRRASPCLICHVLLAVGLGSALADGTNPPADVGKLTAASTDLAVTLEWDNPADADFDGVLVLRREGAPVADSPVDGESYTVGQQVSGWTSEIVCVTTAAASSCTDASVLNDMEYHFESFSYDTSRNYSPGVHVRGLPRSDPYKWAFTTRAASLAPVGAIPGSYLVSIGDDQLLHRMSEANGQRGTDWSPPQVGGAVQSRPMVGDLSPAADANDLTGFVSSQDGSLYRFGLDQDGTAEAIADVATDAGCPGGFLQAGPVVMLDLYEQNNNPYDDAVVIATRCLDVNGDGTANDNQILLYSHSLGTLFSTYDGDADGGGELDSPGLGISNATPRIFYRDTGNNLAYVPVNEDRGDDESLVVLEVRQQSGTPVFDIPAYSELHGLGDVNTDPTVFRYGIGNDFRLLFGNDDGTIYLYDALLRTGGASSPLAQRDLYTVSDGPVKGVAVSTGIPIGGGLFEYWVVWSTDNLVHGIRIQPGTGKFSPSSYWSRTIPDDASALTGPSEPVVLRWVGGVENTRAFVGASDGVLYELDATTGTTVRSWSVEPSATLGAPTFDYNDGVSQGIVIGSTSGVVHWVSLD
ncbi:MAG: hypothetical protein JSV80_13895 [Acidobacteriota bacterium]|nr:MAG: hypothetical protein JSV80_13895 [Acidobacteriota bacterium]